MASSAYAIEDTDRKFGAGLMIGSSTGFNFKHWFKEKDALDFYLSFSDNKVEIHTDYLRHKKDLIKIGKEKLSLHFGAGVKILNKDNGKDQIGIRVPIGVDYFFKNFSSVPVEIFLEIAPVLNFVTETDLDINGYLGVRYYF